MGTDKAENQRWTEVEHLPEWDEDFYWVYTAKKFGKWVMLKTLRPEYRDNPEYQKMLEREFDTRYNLAHPNIIMINDLEDVPGVGRSIITDDVYGLSLRNLIDTGKVTQHHIEQLAKCLPSAMQYIEANHIVHHPIQPDTIIFTENVENLKLIDVGFEQRPNLSPVEVSDDIYNYGLVLCEALDKSGIQDPHLHKIAHKCIDPDADKRYKTVDDLRMAIAGRSKTALLLTIIGFLLIMIGILILLILTR